MKEAGRHTREFEPFSGRPDSPPQPSWPRIEFLTERLHLPFHRLRLSRSTQNFSSYRPIMPDKAEIEIHIEILPPSTYQQTGQAAWPEHLPMLATGIAEFLRDAVPDS